MRVIVSPGPSFASNPLFKNFNDELSRRGHQVLAPKILNSFVGDIFHINFPEHMVSEKTNILRALASAFMMLGFILILKIRNKKIIWTVHDVLPLRKNHPRLCHFYMRLIRKLTSTYIFLSPSSLKKFIELYPDQEKKFRLELFLPTSNVNFHDKLKIQELRISIGIRENEFVVGYLGDIKEYKNPSILSLLPDSLSDGRRVILLIAGKEDGARSALSDEVLKKSNTIRINNRLDDNEFEKLIQLVDVVFLPYSWGWNSGLLCLVLSCHQKGLTSNLPIFTDLQKIFGHHWITQFNMNSENLRKELSDALTLVSSSPSSSDNLNDLTNKLEELSLDHYTDQIERLYNAE